MVDTHLLACEWWTPTFLRAGMAATTDESAFTVRPTKRRRGPQGARGLLPAEKGANARSLSASWAGWGLREAASEGTRERAYFAQYGWLAISRNSRETGAVQLRGSGRESALSCSGSAAVELAGSPLATQPSQACGGGGLPQALKLARQAIE